MCSQEDFQPSCRSSNRARLRIAASLPDPFCKGYIHWRKCHQDPFVVQESPEGFDYQLNKTKLNKKSTDLWLAFKIIKEPLFSCYFLEK